MQMRPPGRDAGRCRRQREGRKRLQSYGEAGAGRKPDPEEAGEEKWEGAEGCRHGTGRTRDRPGEAVKKGKG